MILVTGATGFVGKELAGRLISKGHSVRVLSRSREEARKLFPKAEIFKADLSDPGSLKGAGKGITAIVHLAGMVSYSKPREEIFAANVRTTRNILENAGDASRIVFSSSVSVYGEIKGKAGEDYPTKPINPYGESKLECERLIRDSGIPHAMLRIAPIYGKGSPSWKKNLKLLEKGFPIPRTKNLTHVVHISDTVQALERAVKKGSGVYNIADREPLPFTDFAETIMKLLGKKPRKMPMFTVKALARAVGMGPYLNVLIMNRHYLIGKAEKDLGFNPKADFGKEIRGMIDWYRSS